MYFGYNSSDCVHLLSYLILFLCSRGLKEDHSFLGRTQGRTFAELKQAAASFLCVTHSEAMFPEGLPMVDPNRPMESRLHLEALKASHGASLARSGRITSNRSPAHFWGCVRYVPPIQESECMTTSVCLSAGPRL